MGGKGGGKGFGGKGAWNKPQVPKAPAENKVYVDFLAYKTTWEGLKQHFSKAGTVAYAKVNCQPGMFGSANPNGWSKGNGLVVFNSPQEALNAVSLLNGSTLDGRQITVSAWGQEAGSPAASVQPQVAKTPSANKGYAGFSAYKKTW